MTTEMVWFEVFKLGGVTPLTQMLDKEAALEDAKSRQMETLEALKQNPNEWKVTVSDEGEDGRIIVGAENLEGRKLNNFFCFAVRPADFS